LLLEEEIDYSCTHNRITKNATSTCLLTSWEWTIIFVLGSNQTTLAFVTFLLIFNSNTASSCQASNSEVAAVAFDTPALLVMVLDTHMTIEALNTEVDEVNFAIIFQVNLVSKQKVCIRIGTVGCLHNYQ